MLTLLYGGHVNGDGVGTVADSCLKTEEVGLTVSFEAVCMVTPASNVPSIVWNLLSAVCEKASGAEFFDVIVSDRANVGNGVICKTFVLSNGWEEDMSGFTDVDNVAIVNDKLQ